MLITREDIQRIGDEDTLLHFLEEKLNLPISEEVSLAQIALPLPLPFLGLDDVIAEHLIDCQDFSGLPTDGLGERRPFLIRFKRESGYSEILREVAEGLFRRNINPAEIFFICADANFQPFAFAYFNNAELENWQTAMLNIFAWTQENTHIHTSSEHKLSIEFFSKESPIKNQGSVSQDFITESTVPDDLLTKLENIGTPLSRQEEILIGITPGYTRAFVIDEHTRGQLLNEDSNSFELIKRLPEPNQKWRCESKYLICIPSGRIKHWPWSNARNELEAEHIFEESYPAISAHLKVYRNRLKTRSNAHQGEFYWELSASSLHSIPEHSKIIYRTLANSMQATYDTLKGLPLSTSFLIPTRDLSLLAILNSRLFGWFAHKKYRRSSNPKIKQLSFSKKNMEKAPIAPRTPEQTARLSDLVQQILDDPDNFGVPNIEREMNALVYKLYELTSQEITLIEKGI